MTDGDTSGNLLSEWLPLRTRDMSFQLLWTGTTSGTVTVLLSNDATNTVVTMTYADFYPNYTNPAGSASGTGAELTTSFCWVRFAYTRSSGTGVLTGKVCSK